MRQKKTGQPVRFELAGQTCEAVDDYIKTAAKKPGELLFASRRYRGRRMTTQPPAIKQQWRGGSNASEQAM